MTSNPNMNENAALDADAEQRRALRALTRAERLALAGELMALAIQCRDIRYRRKYPDLSPEELRARQLEEAIAAMDYPAQRYRTSE